MKDSIEDCQVFKLGQEYAAFQHYCNRAVIHNEVKKMTVGEGIAELCFNFCRDNGLSVYSRKIINTDRVRMIVCPQLSEDSRDLMESHTIALMEDHCRELNCR